MRFFNPQQLTTSPQLPRERLDPGPPPGRNAQSQFAPEAQSLLVTFATNAPEFVGSSSRSTKPQLSVGRRADQDSSSPRPPSRRTRDLRWQPAPGRSTTSARRTALRRPQLRAEEGRHADARRRGQLGELRVKLVSFGPESPHHRRAGSSSRSATASPACSSASTCSRHRRRGRLREWAELPLHIARYELRGPNRSVSERPTILEMLALRKAAQRVVELTETLTMSIIPLVSGRTGPLKFIVSMVGPPLEEARHIVEQVVAQVQGIVPDTLELGAALIKGEPGRPGRSLLD
jgi:eukaryotic-like serine/threonine-protein kinase